MNKPPIAGARDLLDRANKSKIPKSTNNNEPIKVNPHTPIPINKEDQKIEEKLQIKLNINNEEIKVNKEEPSTSNPAPQQQKFVKRLQNSMRKFNNTDQNPDHNPTSIPNSLGNSQLTAPKKGMTKIVQSKKILDTAKFLENKMLKTESSDSQTSQLTEGSMVNTEENKTLEVIKENVIIENQMSNEHQENDDEINKTSVKTGVRKPTKKPIV